MKPDRQEEIVRIIENEEIETQEQLACRLRERGYNVTQATVSRDIKELRLIKVTGHQSAYRYAKPGRHESAVNGRMIRLLSDSTVSATITTSGNWRCISLEAAMPSMRGICMSMKTKP